MGIISPFGEQRRVVSADGVVAVAGGGEKLPLVSSVLANSPALAALASCTRLCQNPILTLRER